MPLLVHDSDGKGLDVAVYCSDCGEGLCHVSSAKFTDRGCLVVKVPVCENCAEKIRLGEDIENE